MDASCLYQCFRRRCNIMGDFLTHFSVPAEHCCWSCPFVTTVCHRWCFQQENTPQFTSSQAGFLVMTLISAPNSLHSQRNGRFKSWMLVWWCHDDVAWPQSVRNVCWIWVMRIKAALKAKQVQPRTNKVYLMKWPESISHNWSHRECCKNYEIL